jgi:hypothetical protein
MNNTKETVIQMFYDCYCIKETINNKLYYCIKDEYYIATVIDKILLRLPLKDLTPEDVIEEYYTGRTYF